jgi:hypothetical protein
VTIWQGRRSHTSYFALLLFVLLASHANSVVGFAVAPVSGCAVPNAEFLVEAQGDATTSDTFSIYANGALIYQWEGETMAWVATSPSPTTYTVAGEPVDLPQNTALTATITTFNQANSLGPIYTAGAQVYRAQASWNCTTGEQIGSIVNADTRPKMVTAMTTPWLASLAGLASIALLAGQRRLTRAHW